MAKTPTEQFITNSQNLANKLSTIIVLKNQTLPTFLNNLQNLMNKTLHSFSFYTMYKELFDGTIANIGKSSKGYLGKIELFKAQIRRTYNYLGQSSFQLYREFGVNLESAYKKNYNIGIGNRLYHSFHSRIRRVNSSIALSRKIDWKYIYHEQVIGQSNFVAGTLPIGIRLNNVDEIVNKINHDLQVLLISSIVNNMFAISVKFEFKFETMDYSTNNYQNDLDLKKAGKISNSVVVQYNNINDCFNGYWTTNTFGNPIRKKGLREVFNLLASSIVYHIYISKIIISIHKP
jgi:hypothetical protein